MVVCEQLTIMWTIDGDSFLLQSSLYRPWQVDLVTTAEKYFKGLILKLDPSMESQLVIGPSFIHPLATARARSMSTFHFLEEVQRSPPSPSVETKPTYVVNAAVVRRQIANGIEPQVPIETTKGSYEYFLVSKIPSLSQWVYDPIYLHTENNGQEKKVYTHAYTVYI